MKKVYSILIAGLVFISCGDNVEKKAAAKLQLATEAFEMNDYDEAKLQIDSIKILYPKAVKARREGIKLMQQVELKEQKEYIIYLDSMLNENEMAFEEIKSRFVLEKDEQYQDIGNYFWPTQTVEKNLERSYLRFQVDELGKMSMTSIYYGKYNINHFAVKVIAPDGTFAETPASEDSYYTTNNLDGKIEKADYTLGKDGNVIGFLYMNKDKNIKVEYLGERKYTTTMSANDRKALEEVYELAQILSSIERIKAEKKEAELKIEFVTRNMERSDKNNED